MFNKSILIGKVIEIVRGEKESNEVNLKLARHAANEAPSAMQSHSDTTRSQLEYLVASLGKIIFEKEQAIKTLNIIRDSIGSVTNNEARVGSIIEVADENDGRLLYFILPAGGGVKIIDEDGSEITIVSASAPLAKSLSSKKIGEQASLTIGQKLRQFKVLDIR